MYNFIDHDKLLEYLKNIRTFKDLFNFQLGIIGYFQNIVAFKSYEVEMQETQRETGQKLFQIKDYFNES